MIRFGLCCLFKEKVITFRHTTAKHLQKFSPSERMAKLAEICLHNSVSLTGALKMVNEMNIKSFRIMTPLFPLYTHPEVGYHLEQLPGYEDIIRNLDWVKSFKEENDIRLSFHPDQFIVLNSPRQEVVESAIQELEYQALLSELVGADVINIHLGGVYGDKISAKERFVRNLILLNDDIKNRLTIENDDKSYTPDDLRYVSDETGIPIVYDVHHHRCNPDALTEKEATDLCIKTWKRVEREPYFHISSPKDGWDSRKTSPHADYIDVADFPDYWKQLTIDFTVDVEAKAKELAVTRLMQQLNEIY